MSALIAIGAPIAALALGYFLFKPAEQESAEKTPTKGPGKFPSPVADDLLDIVAEYVAESRPSMDEWFTPEAQAKAFRFEGGIRKPARAYDPLFLSGQMTCGYIWTYLGEDDGVEVYALTPRVAGQHQSTACMLQGEYLFTADVMRPAVDLRGLEKFALRHVDRLPRLKKVLATGQERWFYWSSEEAKGLQAPLPPAPSGPAPVPVPTPVPVPAPVPVPPVQPAPAPAPFPPAPFPPAPYPPAPYPPVQPAPAPVPPAPAPPAPVPPAPVPPAPSPPAPAPPAPTGFDALVWEPPPLTPAMRESTRDLYENGTPMALRDAARTYREKGYDRAATNLEKRADEVETELEIQGRIIRIKPGYNPSMIAKHYTGNPNPRELMHLNNIQLKDGMPHPWELDQKVLLPKSYDVRKGPPKPISGAAAKKSWINYKTRAAGWLTEGEDE